MQPTSKLSPKARQLSTTETNQLRRVLAAKGLRGPDIDDAVQEVNLKVLWRAPSDAPLLPWAMRVAVNVAMDHHRRERRARRRDEAIGRVSTVAAPHADVAESVALATALSELAFEHQAVVRLHLLGGLTLAETGRRLGVPEGTVKSRLHRALAQLRLRLGVSRDRGPRGPPMAGMKL